jgi:MFS family permease
MALITAGGVVTWLLIIDGVGDISFRMSFDLMPIYLEEIGGMTVTQIGLLNSIVGIAAMAFTPLGGVLSDRKEERLPIVLGTLVTAASLGTFVRSDSFAGFSIAWILFGISWGLSGPAYQSLVSKAVPKRLLGTAYGFFDTSLGLISLPAPWLGGQIWTRITPQAPFLITMVISAISAWPVWLKFRLKEKEIPASSESLAVEG